MAIPTSTNTGKVGKGRIGAGSAVITLHEWSVRETPDEIDATTAEDDGYLMPDTGCIGIEANIRGHYLINVTRLNLLFSGQRGTLLYLYTWLLAPDTGPFWLLPAFVVTAMGHQSRVRGTIEFECTVKSRGTFTRPVDPA